MSRYTPPASMAVVSECMALVAPAEAAFSSRWRLSTLERIDKALHARLLEQSELYNSEIIGGTADELREQSAAMVRGWAAACSRMEQEPHDAYLIGIDWPSRTQVVISDNKASLVAAKAKAHPDCRIVAIGPDEVAKLVGRMDIVAQTKAAFPDAEIIDIQLQPKEAA